MTIKFNFTLNRLDQQIWGSEDEEELNEEEQGKQKEKEEKGKGESTGEKEMSAKDDQEQGADDGADGKDKKKKKDINEMEEPELDDDQVSLLDVGEEDVKELKLMLYVVFCILRRISSLRSYLLWRQSWMFR